jgi:hypothetical protein
VPSPARIVSSPSSSPAFCLQGECPPFYLSVGVCFRHANTTALDIRTQRSPVPASRPNIQPRENQQDVCVALAYSRESSPCSVLTFYPHKIGIDSSLTPATFLQQSGLRLPALVRDPTRFGSATTDLALDIDTEPAHASARNPRVGSCVVQGFRKNEIYRRRTPIR